MFFDFLSWADKRFLCSLPSDISHFRFKLKLLNRQMVLWLGVVNFRNRTDVNFCLKYCLLHTWVQTRWPWDFTADKLVKKQLWDQNNAALKQTCLCGTTLAQAVSLLIGCLPPCKLSTSHKTDSRSLLSSVYSYVFWQLPKKAHLLSQSYTISHGFTELWVGCENWWELERHIIIQAFCFATEGLLLLCQLKMRQFFSC